MRFLLIITCLSIVMACELRDKPAETNETAKAVSTQKENKSGAIPPKEAPPKNNNDAALRNPNLDPEEGDFTLEEALDGLEGEGDLHATIETNMGTIECILLPDLAPNTVANFVGLARGTRPFYDLHTGVWTKKPFYDGLLFHRVIPKFMIQGGDPRGSGREGPGYKIKDEFTNKMMFDSGGKLAMAHAPQPNSGGSQFFITEVPYPLLNKKYAIFGTCKNLDVVKKIARVPKGATGKDRPNADIFMEKITISY